MRVIKYFSVFIALISIFSCTKNKYDFNNINVEEYSPAVAAPLVSTKFKLHDLLNDYMKKDSALLSIDKDSLLMIRYSNDLFSMKLDELFSIPDQSINQAYGMQSFSMDPINTTASITLGDVVGNFSDPEKTLIQSNDGGTAPFPALPSQSGGEHSVAALSGFTTVNFAGGTMDISIENNWPVAISIDIALMNSSDNSVIGTVSFPSIPPGQKQTKSIDLTGKTMNNAIKFGITSISSPGSGLTPVNINLSDDLAITVATNNLSVSGGTAVFPSQDIIDTSFNVDMAQGNGENLKTLRLKSGTLSMNLQYGIQENATLTLSMPYAKKGGVAFSQTINLTGGNNSNNSFDLSGYEFDLTAGGSKTNNIQAKIKASIVSSGNPVPFSLTDSVKAAITMGSLKLEYLDGDVGTQTFTVKNDTAAFNMDALKTFDANITLADPKLTLSISNSFGLEMGANLSSIYAANDNQQLQLTGLPNPTVIKGPSISEVGQTKKTDIVISNATTNIGDILNIKPNKFIFGMSGSTNPNGPTTNFLLDTSKITASMDLEIPLYGGISGFQLKDTLDFPQDAFENVKTATLRSYIVNEFPVGVQVQIYFTDQNYIILDSLNTTKINVLKSSSVDANGELTQASVNTTDITLKEATVKNLKNAKKILVVSELATANNGATNAKFYSKYELEIKLGIYAKVKVSLKDNNN